MKQVYFFLFFTGFVLMGFSQDLKITGIVDGPLSGGVPKAVELYATSDISDLSQYGIGSANNGGGSDGEEFTFPAISVVSGTFLYVASETQGFNNFFGFNPDFTSSALAVNGDDAVELFFNGVVADTFGDINTDGNGEPWEYLDGWAYRNNTTGPDGATFVVNNWSFSGPNALDGTVLNASAPNPFPIGTFGGNVVTIVPNPTNFNAIANGTDAITLNWQLNTNQDTVVLATSGIQITENLVDGTNYTVGDTLPNGSTILYVGNALTFAHENLTANTNYFYMIWSVNTSTEYSSGLETDARTDSDQPLEAKLLITGAFDGPLSGGTPKGVELYATEDIQDLSLYGIGSANNGGGTDGQEFTFPSAFVPAGAFIYVATESNGFTSFFGFAPDYTTGALAVNGDDAIELFFDGTVIDTFGDIDTDGSGQPWEYLDGWAYRKDFTTADGGNFEITNWMFSGPNSLDAAVSNASANVPFPLKAYGPDLLVTGVVDGPLSGGVPKAVELYVRNPIEDLSLYGIGSANNGGGTDGQEFAFPAVSVAAETYIYIATETNGFTSYFGFAPDYTTSVAAVNGDDAVELFFEGEVIDTYGEINTDGTGQPWEYLDGWAYRKEGTLNQGGFILDDWSFSGTNALDGTVTNDEATLPFPIGTYANDGNQGNDEIISIALARSSMEGSSVTVSGVLTVADEFSGSAYLQDSSGAIAVFDEKVHGEALFKIGDSITITGIRSAFNEQIQISPVLEVTNNGLPSSPIEVKDITLAELDLYPAQLVRITDVTFPRPSDLLFGNSNYILSDTSGTGELRLDADVNDLVGLAQPETCTEVVGVIGRFFEIYQLLPRNKMDLSCAIPYVPTPLPIPVDAANTLEVVTWNIEWFGDEDNSPAAGNSNPDEVQKNAVKAIINELDADVLAVQEIADDTLFSQMVSELDGYNFVLSPATSRPNDPGVKQKVGFIYKTETVSITDTKVLLESIHPLYNGGDASALVNYPSETDRFYASGRLPFLMSADVTLNGQTIAYDFVALHARANSSNEPQERYDMRKYDVEVLRDSLNQFFPDSKLMLLGDFNDDVDETVADINSSVSSYEAYTNDTVNFDLLTDVLSAQGLRSFVFRENMIDHILVTNELKDQYIDKSATVHYEFFDSSYAETASDHFPVSVRMQLAPLAVDSIIGTTVVCSNEKGNAKIMVSGGIPPYNYQWSDGQTGPEAINLSGGSYNVFITDALLNSVLAEVEIIESDPITVTVSEDTKVYYGYQPKSCTNLGVLSITGGNPEYSIEWSTGEITEQIQVCPETTTTYTVTITDNSGCSVLKTVTVEVQDVSCSQYGKQKVLVCYLGKTKCVSKYAVPYYLYYGATLGSCEDGNTGDDLIITAAPNPFRNKTTLSFSSPTEKSYKVAIFNQYGWLVYWNNIPKNTTSKTLRLGYLRNGIYFLNIYDKGKVVKSIRLLKK